MIQLYTCKSSKCFEGQTPNFKSPNEWGNLIGDQGVTTTILERFRHRVEVIYGGKEEESQRIWNWKSIFSGEV